ncbi:hypothetical protein DFA_06955 [Cavenderia fasciculata]|uniref:Ankyrin repeat-containing protein n=1 Tax=Cavenderia fasciculata TaxID=261658 RepID=F4PX49_CACFS|nr:uncharacterized protein DFA_06955 [Cavenderia fasciculata]EGG19852.1 hypothetical protein DFA_06955 [Cavenderia fasciculata]|eukprot:XP_004358198.1 hypothetical protein DFA_06955 [Cavenderia fasciculata]
MEERMVYSYIIKTATTIDINEETIKRVLTNKILFRKIIQVGRKTTQNLLQCYSYNQIISVEWMIVHGHLGLLEYKLKRDDPLHFTLVSIELVCKCIGGGGDSSSMSLFTRIYEKKRSMFYANTLLEYAASSGNMKCDRAIFVLDDFVRWFQDLASLSPVELGRVGALEIVEWVLETFIGDQPSIILVRDARELTALFGRLSRIEQEYLCFVQYSTNYTSYCVIDYKHHILTMYSKYYQLETESVVETLNTEQLAFITHIFSVCNVGDIIQYGSVPLLRCAWAIKGQGYFASVMHRFTSSDSLEALEYIHEKIPNCLGRKDLQYAITNHHADIVQFIAHHYPNLMVDLGNDSLILDAYTSLYDPHVAKVLIDNDATSHPVFDQVSILPLATTFPSLDALIFYLTYIDHTLESITVNFNSEDELPILKYLVQHYGATLDMNSIMKKACESGYLSFVQYLVEIHYEKSNTGIASTFVDTAFVRGHRSIVHYLVTEKQNHFGQSSWQKAGSLGDADLFEFVISHTIPSQLQSAIKTSMLQACKNGMFNLIQYIHNNYLINNINNNNSNNSNNSNNVDSIDNNNSEEEEEFLFLSRLMIEAVGYDQSRILKYLIDNTKVRDDGSDKDKDVKLKVFKSKSTRTELLETLMVSIINGCQLECFKLLVDSNQYNYQINKGHTMVLAKHSASFPLLLHLIESDKDIMYHIYTVSPTPLNLKLQRIITDKQRITNNINEMLNNNNDDDFD